MKLDTKVCSFINLKFLLWDYDSEKRNRIITTENHKKNQLCLYQSKVKPKIYWWVYMHQMDLVNAELNTTDVHHAHLVITCSIPCWTNPVDPWRLNFPWEEHVSGMPPGEGAAGFGTHMWRLLRRGVVCAICYFSTLLKSTRNSVKMIYTQQRSWILKY